MIFATDPGLTMFEPRPGTYDRMTGIQRNVTVPVHAITLPEGGTYYPATGFMTDITGNTLFASAGSIADAPFHVGYDLMGGQEIWAKDRTNDASSWIVHSATGQGVYAQWDTNNLDWVGYNAATGQKLWVSDPEVYPFGSYQANSIGGVIADGMLYSGGMDGYEHAIDITTGKEVWKFSSGFTAETAYNTYPMGTGPIVGGGVVYCGVGEHSPTHPLYRGGKLYALDAKTGTELWEINGYFSVQAIADGYLVAQNQYDNQIYVFGKGPSATEVSLSQNPIVQGSSTVIQGKVTD